MSELIKRLNEKMMAFKGMDKNQTYWYRCGMYDAIEIIKRENLYTAEDMANGLNEYAEGKNREI